MNPEQKEIAINLLLSEISYLANLPNCTEEEILTKCKAYSAAVEALEYFIDWDQLKKDYLNFCKYKNLTNLDIFKWFKKQIQLK